MAEQGQVVKAIDYKSTFPFTQIFRSFRAAVHPSKLILALVAILLIYVGGKVLDTIWVRTAVPNEIGLYAGARERTDSTQTFLSAREDARKAADVRYREWLRQGIGYDKTKTTTQPARDLSNEQVDDQGSFGDVKDFLVARREAAIRDVDEEYGREKTRIEDVYRAVPQEPRDKKREAETARDDALRATASERDARYRRIFDDTYESYVEAKEARGIGLFSTFVSYQIEQLNRIVFAVRDGSWLGSGGVIDRIVGFFTVAPVWALRHHPFFFAVFFLFFLSVWAVFGGAIARISAVHIARDEKISIRQALRFSTAKFLSFVSAPIIPLIIVVAVGLLVSAGGLLANIPFIGPIVVGALFFLALAAGFVMTLVMLGLAGGFNLMYPTIAVEGSDSFDAISRSFSYLYARPWRLAFYTAVAVLYGGLTYMFIRYFVDVLLMLTHFFAGLLVFGEADSTVPLWNALWAGPTVIGRLAYTPEYFSLGSGESIGAFLIWMWTQLLAALLGAFAVSFYFVANTVIYYLMRKEVDATELDDVYLEQGDEDFAETTPMATVPGSTGETVTTTTTTVVTEPPPAT